MAVTTTTHLNFHGDARAALEFYGTVFGGTVTVATYGDFGMPAELPDAGNVVFGRVDSGSGFRIMAYDVPSAAGTAAPAPTTRREHGTTLTDQPFFVAVSADTVAEVEALWAGLSDGGTVVEPLGPAQWAPAFGMVTDRFGVTWILDVVAAHDAAGATA
ncbi:VOC family protein [Pseudonocardia sp. HH130630-07]|uniref:VOC family protein n=1 Tax=Pseudonocardia sp. HH130630-07 TaxID=1690815 RepID=UPI00081505F9|nr:VOC family protein [Pseudonocardia sp. HH130630-07]ANY06280.1 bleomycin resistance protein [Pseudonocardia sp. HH130630-07]